jgi:hypothetical protein
MYALKLHKCIVIDIIIIIIIIIIAHFFYERLLTWAGIL